MDLNNKSPIPYNEVILRNEVVQRVNKAKFLGVVVDHPRAGFRNLGASVSQTNLVSPRRVCVYLIQYFALKMLEAMKKLNENHFQN